MKGRKLVLMTCVIVLGFAGVGYSAWTEGLSIKSFFVTGNVHILFHDPEVFVDGLEIEADADDGVLTICGTVAPDCTEVLVEYDIYNDSSIPVKYDPDEEDLPEGITLDQDDTVIRPGEYLRGNQLTLVPGKNELILPFIQYNASGGGWKEELRICWNITVAEEIVEPELTLATESAIVEEAPIEDSPLMENHDSGNPPSEGSMENEPNTETMPDPDSDNSPDSNNAPDPDNPPDQANSPDPINTPDPAMNPTEEPMADEPPAEDPPTDENLNDEGSEVDEGSEDNVGNGEE